MLKYYNNLYAFFNNPEERFISQFNSAKYKFNILKNFINFDSAKNVLEIGCGTGGILSFFQSIKCDVTGVDYENDHLEFARKKNIKTFSDYKNIDKKFDIVILSHVLEHLVEPDEVLNNCKKLLKKNGLIYIEVPSIESIPKHYDYNLSNYLHIAHVTHFTKNTFINFINLKGFEIKYIDNNIHAVISHGDTIEKVVNNYNNTKKILKNIELKKLVYSPIKNIFKFCKKIIKSHYI